MTLLAEPCDLVRPTLSRRLVLVSTIITLVLLDLAIATFLWVGSVQVRSRASGGDLWLDEADYAMAGARGFEANRWDRSPPTDAPDKLVRLRHYHPPMVAFMAAWSQARSRSESSMRLPAVWAGSATVVLTYVSALLLLSILLRRDKCARPETLWARVVDADRSLWPLAARAGAFAAAYAVLHAHPHVRASSHLLPWSFIALCLVWLVGAGTAFAATRHGAWLPAIAIGCGALFATSEYFFPTMIATGAFVGLIIGLELRAKSRRAHILLWLLAGVACFAAVAEALWPAGIRGGAITMLDHYIAMADDSWPVTIAGVVYEHAPRWSYAYWFKRDYPHLLWWFAGAAPALAVLALTRRWRMALIPVLALSVMTLAVMHVSHIIGPEYSSHVLPLLAIMGSLAVVVIALLSRALAAAVAILAAITMGPLPDASELPGMDARAQHPRWSHAAKYLAKRWHPSDRMLAPSYGVLGRWYLVHAHPAATAEWQVQGLPRDEAKETLLRELLTGMYTYVAVGSTFSDWCPADNRIRLIIASWPVVWSSYEHGAGPPRLRIHRVPAGTCVRHPLPAPPGVLPTHGRRP